MNYVKLFWNSGSVPDPYFYQFNLDFFEDGNVNLNISKGRDSEVEIIESDSKKISPQLITELLKQSDRLIPTSKKGVTVGGPEKFIEINQNKKVRILTDSGTNKMVSDYFIKCLQLYGSGLKKRLEAIF